MIASILALLPGFVELQDPLLVKGRILDESGAAVADASLELERDAGEFAGSRVKGMTDTQGFFGLSAEDARGVWRLCAAAGNALAKVHDIPGEWKTLNMGNVVLFAPAELQGFVRTEKGEPIAGATVHARAELDRGVKDLTATTDASGKFLLTGVPKGRLWIGAEAGGFADGVRRGFVVRGETARADLILSCEVPVQGRVVDDAGVPVVGADVLVRRPGALASPWRVPVKTAADGSFTARGLDDSGNAYEVRLSKFGYVSVETDAKSLLFEKPMVLPRGLVVDVRIEPALPLARLELEAMTKVGEGYKRAATVADPLTQERLPNGNLRVTAPRGDYLRVHLTLQGGGLASSAHVEIVKQKENPPVLCVDASKPIFPVKDLPPRDPPTSVPAFRPSVRIEGSLTYGVMPADEPTPIALYKSLYNPETKTRRTEFVTSTLATVGGDFVVQEVAPGRYATIPKRPAPAWSGSHRSFLGEIPPFHETGWQRSIEIPEGVREVQYALSVARPQDRWVQGSVWLDGRPAGDLTLDLIPRVGSDGAGSATTDPEGNYRIPNVKSGEFDLVVRGRGFRDTRRVKLTDGQSRQMNFEFQRSELRGRCVNSEGAPVECTVLLQRQQTLENAEWWHWVSPRVDTVADGSFAFAVLTPGRYRIVTFDPRHRYATIASEPFETTARQVLTIDPVVVPRSCALRVSAVDKQNGPGTGRVWVMVVDGAPPLAHLAQSWLFAQQEAVILHGLPPGRYRVKMPAYEEQEIDLRPATGLTPLHFKIMTPEDHAEPASGSAYQSPEAKSQKQWDWGGETPELFETEAVP